MSRPLLRCSSINAHLQEHVFRTTAGATETSPPVLCFNSKPTRDTVPSVSNFISKFDDFLTTTTTTTSAHGYSGTTKAFVSASISSYFPTHQDVQDAQELVRQTGATTVLGVGSGVAMDLVKALDDDEKLLIPATSTAILAANTPYALILDVETQLLRTKMTATRTTATGTATPNTSSGHATSLFGNELQKQNITKNIVQPGTIVASPFTAPACRSICVDACYRVPERLPDLHLAKMALAMDTVIDGPLAASWHLEAGQSLHSLLPRTQTLGVCRSAPLTLAVSLLPLYFPRASLFGFWAALLPGLAQTLFQQRISRRGLPHFKDFWATPSEHVSVESLLSQVQLSQHYHTFGGGGGNVGGGDVTDLEMEQLEQILSYSLSNDD